MASPVPVLPRRFEEMTDLIIEKVHHRNDWSPAEKAIVLKSLGGVHESAGRPLDAVVTYETAMFFHPRMDVARRLRELRRKLGK